MTNHQIFKKIDASISKNKIKWEKEDHGFYLRLISNAEILYNLFYEIYSNHDHADILFEKLIETIIINYKNRNKKLLKRDLQKLDLGHWFLSNELAGMSLYVDRFCNSLANMPDKLDYLQDLGINLIHLMPLFESPENESDGGYAVSDFRKVDKRFGTLCDLENLQEILLQRDMYLMLDIVLNHTSNQHEWAKRAMNGEKEFQDYYYMYDTREIPDRFESTMPEIFPDNAPGNFTYLESCNKWVMSVFHNYQWDLNYSNPNVFISMMDNIFFYANLGVDILRIDAPAFIWKKIGTSSQNLTEAHTLLRLIKCCVNIATPGMALLGEAIVAPREIIKYFGTHYFRAKECDFAYNATQMALQWDTLATSDTRIMLSAQSIISEKPLGTSWINYIRCHDDIGLGYTDEMITSAGFEPFQHRQFIKNYYSGNFAASFATGALFSFNPKTGDARISGTLASLCGLEKAINKSDKLQIELSIQKILMMQAVSIFIGGLPMIFYGDEVGYTNDYNYQKDGAKSFDNRWMHRPIIDWDKNNKAKDIGTIENKIFYGLKKLLAIRKELGVVSDYNNIQWLTTNNINVAGFARTSTNKNLYCLFNFRNTPSFLTWFALKEQGSFKDHLFDLWSGKNISIGPDNEYMILEPFGIYILEEKH